MRPFDRPPGFAARLGGAAALFFLVKGLLWLLIPACLYAMR